MGRDSTSTDSIELILRHARAYQAEIDSWLKERLEQQKSSEAEPRPPAEHRRFPERSRRSFLEAEESPSDRHEASESSSIVQQPGDPVACPAYAPRLICVKYIITLSICSGVIPTAASCPKAIRDKPGRQVHRESLSSFRRLPKLR